MMRYCAALKKNLFLKNISAEILKQCQVKTMHRKKWKELHQHIIVRGGIMSLRFLL